MSSPLPTAIVLCGGKTTRFGAEKALAVVGGRRVVDRVIEAVRPLVHRVIAVTAAARPALDLPGDVLVVADAYPGGGPLGGICTGLLHAPSDAALVVGCDMPFLDRRLLQLLLDLAAGFEAVVPRLPGGQFEPLHAVYARACRPKLEARVHARRLALWEALADLRTRHVEEAEYRPLDPDGLSFFNLNVPEDLERANRIAAKMEAGRASG